MKLQQRVAAAGGCPPTSTCAEMSSRSIWGFSLRDDDDSDGDDEPTQPRPPAPPARPLSELDLVIASAEPDAETENDDDEAVPDKEREEVDIGAVDEGPIHFVETPFTIASRLAASRKRLANNADSDTATLPAKVRGHSAWSTG